MEDGKKERIISNGSVWRGILYALLFLAVTAAWAIIASLAINVPELSVLSLIPLVCLIVTSKGYFTLQPNESMVFTLFGKYKGTTKTEGLGWRNPFYSKRRLSLRHRNFNLDKIKVNDALGNPIEISAVVVWKVEDTYQACFQIDNYAKYVENQSESALRILASMYPYDHMGQDDTADQKAITLRGNSDEVTESLKKSVQERLDKVGVEVLEARINHLAYAPEIALSMLQRQQAVAVLAARKVIVEGAVSLIENTMKELNKRKVIALTDKTKAEIVSNLLVVLCSDKSAQPIISTGADK